MEKQQVNFMVGRFQPFTSGHLYCIGKAAAYNTLPTVLCMIETSVPTPNKPFTSDFLLPIYKELQKQLNATIADIVLVKSANIIEISETLDKLNYSPVLWICGSDRAEHYQKMLQKYASECHLDAFSRTFPVDRASYQISATNVREFISDGNFEDFIKHTPYWNYLGAERTIEIFNELKNKLNNGK